MTIEPRGIWWIWSTIFFLTILIAFIMCAAVSVVSTQSRSVAEWTQIAVWFARFWRVLRLHELQYSGWQPLAKCCQPNIWLCATEACEPIHHWHVSYSQHFLWCGNRREWLYVLGAACFSSFLVPGVLVIRRLHAPTFKSLSSFCWYSCLWLAVGGTVHLICIGLLPSITQLMIWSWDGRQHLETRQKHSKFNKCSSCTHHDLLPVEWHCRLQWNHLFVGPVSVKLQEIDASILAHRCSHCVILSVNCPREWGVTSWENCFTIGEVQIYEYDCRGWLFVIWP